jgi:hypothetical protein
MGRRRTHQRGALVAQAEQLAELARSSPAPAAAFARAVEILVKEASPTATRAMQRVLHPRDEEAASPARAVAETADTYGGLSEDMAAKPRHQRVRSLGGAAIRHRARQRILEEEVLSSSEVSELLGSESKNSRQYAMELRKRGELLGVEVRNRHLYPAFQFDVPRRRVYDVVKKVGRILGSARDPWGVLSWWLSPNARIPGSRVPKELLADPHQHRVLLELAEAVTGDSG